MTAPSLAVFMICKNEEAHIGKALASVAGIARVAVVVDTGSTDNTQIVAMASGTDSFCIHRLDYFNASERDESGNWVLWDFAKARNFAAEWAEEVGCSHVMWLDADDVVENPERIARALYRDDADVFSMTVESGGMRWSHHRLWRTDKHVRFRGRCHEYPVIDGLRSMALDVTIRHDNAPAAGQENANARNLRMLMREWEERPDDPRTAFYIAQTHKDAGRHAEAAEWYERRITMPGPFYWDEMLFARLYCGREHLALGHRDQAWHWWHQGQELAPYWAEFKVELARLYLTERDYAKAIGYALEAFDAPIPPTELWREVNAYTDQPCRLLSFCYEAQGDTGKACAWARMAMDRIGVPDKEWQARVATLEAQLVKPQAPAIVTRRKERVALVRPGAIGDVLMTLNLLPAFKEANPDAEIHYYTSVEGLDEIIRAAGVKRMQVYGNTSRQLKNPFAAGYDRVINLVGYPLAEGYPEKPMRRHLLEYFAEEMGLANSVLPPNSTIVPGTLQMCPLPALELPLPPRPKHADGYQLVGPYATVQVRAGWSKYKEWPTDKWADVIGQLPFPVYQIGAIKELGEEIAIGSRSGAEWLGVPLADSIALVANARMHLGIDSFANHLTNYFWRDGRSARRVPGVILWGSTQWQAAGYPHNVNISKGLYCQPCFRENNKISKMPRGPCINPPRPTYDDDTPWRCMEEISVDEVVEAALKLWEQTRRTNNARNE